MRPRRGTTLIELMVTCGVYAFMVLALIALVKDGTNGWRNVESRTTVQANLRTFENDIIRELQRTDLATVRIFSDSFYSRSSDSYKHGIVMASAMNETDDPTTLGDPLQYFVKTSGNVPKPHYQRWVLYYLTRMDKQEEVNEYGYASTSYASDPNPDNIDPHKWIVRKDIYYNPSPSSTAWTITKASDLTDPAKNGSAGFPFIEGNSGHGGEPTKTSLTAEETSYNSSSLISRAHILATDVLALNFNVLAWDSSINGYRAVGTFDGSDSIHPISGTTLYGKPFWDNNSVASSPYTGLHGTIIEFDVKTFKSEQAQTYLNLGQTDLSNNPYTVQLDCQVEPNNDTSPSSGQAAGQYPLATSF